MSDTDTLPEQVQVGRSGLFVHRAGLGTMQFGWSVDEPGAFAVMDAYVERGGNFVDTADCYSSWASTLGGPANAGGVSEEIVGRWMAERGNRDDIVLATKVRAAMGELFSDGRTTVKQREGLSRRWITRACEDSLRRLGPTASTCTRRTGSTRWCRSRRRCRRSTTWCAPARCATSAARTSAPGGSCRRCGRPTSTGSSASCRCSPSTTCCHPPGGTSRPRSVRCARTTGSGVFPYSPLAGGVLTGKYREGAPLPDSVRAEENVGKERLDATNRRIIDEVVAVGERTGRTAAQVAIAWLIAKPWVTAPILGANRPEQLAGVMDGLEVPLPADEVAALDSVSDFHRSRPTLEA